MKIIDGDAFNALKRISALTFLTIFAVGCSESGFQDFMDVGKYSPDEHAVEPGRELVMPPDLRLPPPGTRTPAQGGVSYPSDQRSWGNPSYLPPSTSPAQPGQIAAPQPVQPYPGQQPPAVYGAPETQAAPGYPYPQPQPQSNQPLSINPALPRQQPGQTAAPPPDIYASYGISRYHRDGRPKTPQELEYELRQAQTARQQQNNPDYGSIWDLPNGVKQ